MLSSSVHARQILGFEDDEIITVCVERSYAHIQVDGFPIILQYVWVCRVYLVFIDLVDSSRGYPLDGCLLARKVGIYILAGFWG